MRRVRVSSPDLRVTMSGKISTTVNPSIASPLETIRPFSIACGLKGEYIIPSRVGAFEGAISATIGGTTGGVFVVFSWIVGEENPIDCFSVFSAFLISDINSFGSLLTPCWFQYNKAAPARIKTARTIATYRIILGCLDLVE